MDNLYWNNYYNTTNLDEISDASNFAKLIKYLIFFNMSNKNLIELGTGNGRDIIYFSQNNTFNCIGLDASLDIINKNNQKNNNNNLKFICTDFTKNLLDYTSFKPAIIYSRFSMHSITHKQMIKTLTDAYNILENNGILCIETRSINDPLYGKGEKVLNEKHAYINTHYRRFSEKKEFENDLESIGYKITSSVEDDKSAWYKDDHACVLRIICKK